MNTQRERGGSALCTTSDERLWKLMRNLVEEYVPCSNEGVVKEEIKLDKKFLSFDYVLNWLFSFNLILNYCLLDLIMLKNNKKL